jgi:hypothetical protein
MTDTVNVGMTLKGGGSDDCSHSGGKCDRIGTLQPSCFLRAAETGKWIDVEAATAQMERALRVDGWL